MKRNLGKKIYINKEDKNDLSGNKYYLNKKRNMNPYDSEKISFFPKEPEKKDTDSKYDYKIIELPNMELIMYKCYQYLLTLSKNELEEYKNNQEYIKLEENIIISIL